VQARGYVVLAGVCRRKKMLWHMRAINARKQVKHKSAVSSQPCRRKGMVEGEMYVGGEFSSQVQRANYTDARLYDIYIHGWRVGDRKTTITIQR